MSDALTVRPCAGCGQEDDHPRIQAIDAQGGVTFYHYDCAPAALLESQHIPAKHPALVATAKGKRGDDLRAVIKSSNLIKNGA